MTTTEAEGEQGATNEPAFTNCVTWVAQWLCPNLEREIKRTFEWCPQWWDHPEAVQRIEALWRAWEFFRHADATGMSTWWTDHADPHLAILCNPDIGPFGHCHTTHGRDVAPLRTTEPPNDWPHWVTGVVADGEPPGPRPGAPSVQEHRPYAGAHDGGAHDGEMETDARNAGAHDG